MYHEYVYLQVCFPQAKGTIEILPYGTLMPPPMQPPPPPAHQQQLRHWQHLQHPNQPHPQVILNCHYESLLLRNSPVTPMLACLQQLKSGGGPAGPKQRRLSKKEQAAAKAMASMNAVGGGGVGSGVAASQIQSGHGYARQHFLPQVCSCTYFDFSMFQCVPKIFFCMYHNCC